jgi:hypothetical protein
MPDPISGLVVAGTTLVGGAIQSSAAGKASRAQQEAAEAGIAEQRRQFEAVQELLKPYVEAGQPALTQQQAILGLGGPEAQRAAIQAIESGEIFQARARQGEEALLQAASATGGLRGGNIQGALAQFRPQMLQSEIDAQYARLGGLTTLGQQSAAGVGSAGLQTGARVAGLEGQIGQARAGADLARGKALSSVFNLPAQFLGAQIGGGQTPGFGNLFGGGGGGGEAIYANSPYNTLQDPGGIAQTNIGYSDIRLKTNIHRISTRPDGLGVYEFEYIWGGGKHIGLMAQEVLGIYPDAVGSVGRYYTVDYSRV